MDIKEEDYLKHYGTPRHSGRYPWGSGEEPYQNTSAFLGHVAELRSKGLSDTDIARGLGMSTTQFRNMRSIAVNEQRAADIAQAKRLRDKGWSPTAIGKAMDKNESTIRSLLSAAAADRVANFKAIADKLRADIEKLKVIDVGAGIENHLGIPQSKLKVAVAMLEGEGYKKHNVKVTTTLGNQTSVKVLAHPDISWADIMKDPTMIKNPVGPPSDDGGRTFLGLYPPKPVSPDRVAVKYAEEGGADADGVMYVRPGVDDVSLGGVNYAQVRVQVGDGHFLKGMAMYRDDLPDGVDILFNTNKSDTGNKLDAMKPLKDDPDNPFGSVVDQITSVDDKGKVTVTSAMNLVNEEGDWDKWSKTLSSQMLSKQKPSLARAQLDLTFRQKQDELDEIVKLTNPVIKKELLRSFSDDVDAAAVQLKAAALPRQRSQVILPINELKETEVYAPNFRQGERVALIRHPHGGTFEIPELVVNNRNPTAKKLLGQATDAIGINAKVAQRLSGADFDGDTVLVIPNNDGKVKSSPALAGLKDFDPVAAYPPYEGMPKMKPATKQREMGVVSNLITDMTIQGATTSELARAVRHSMVVIDAEKHNLNYKLSAEVNGIKALQDKYQKAYRDTNRAGAATLISRAKSLQNVPERIPRRVADGGPIDPETGRKVYTPTNASYINAKGKEVFKTEKSTKLAETDDAHTLSSGTPIERVYANHSNRLKNLANTARKESLGIKSAKYSPSAAKAYAREVATLEASLNLALKNAPLERQAQILASTTVAAKRRANPGMEGAEVKKLKSQALEEARARTRAGKQLISISDREWEAIQAGAVSNHKLEQIIKNANLDDVKRLATPRTATGMSSAKLGRARAMMNSGYTQSEIADALGVSLSTLKGALSNDE